MTENYLGEIRLFSFGFAPKDWHLCDGTLLNIRENTALFALIGVAYGGDGITTFALPDLRGRTAIDMGQKTSSSGNYRLGQAKGHEGITLVAQEMPKHNHLMQVDNSNGNKGILGNILAIPNKDNVTVNIYNDNNTPVAPLNPNTIGADGGNADHDNMQPFLTVNFCIATTGAFPPRPD